MRLVTVALFNRSAMFTGWYPKKKFQRILSYYVPGYWYMKLVKEGKWDGKIKLITRHKTTSGTFITFRKQLEEECKVQFEVEDLRERTKYLSLDESEFDRKYQLEAVQAMRKAKCGGLVLAPTGSGKTYIVGMYFKYLVGRAIFVVDELTLLHQAKEELEKVIGERVGTVGESKYNPRRITVATIQTLQLHTGDPVFDEWKSKVRAVVIDELHLHLNKRTKEVITDIKPRVVFGLTATLEMQKKHVRMAANAMVGRVIFDYQLQEATEEKFLTPGIVASVEVRQHHEQHEKYHVAYDDLIVNSDKRNDLITDLVEYCHEKGRNIVVLVERVKHLKQLSRMLEHVPHRVVYGERKVEDRIKAKKAFQKEKIRLLIANKVFKKGIDIKNIDTIVECAAMRSKNDAIQKYGRGVRLSEGKVGMIYFDISDRRFDKFGGWENRFHSCTSSRLNAFKDKGIPIITLRASMGARKILKKASRFLRRHIQEE